MSMLANTPQNAAKELIDKMPKEMTVQEFLTNILPLYPNELSAFQFVNKENGELVLNCPFPEPLNPMANLINQALQGAMSAQGGNNASNIANVSNQQVISAGVQSGLGKAVIDVLHYNRQSVEGELGYSLEDLFKQQCGFVRIKEKESESLIIADAGGNVKGDIVEIGVEIRS